MGRFEPVGASRRRPPRCLGSLGGTLVAVVLGVAVVDAGQETVVRGIVRGEAGKPLAGVQVYVRGGLALAATTPDGRFELRTAATGPQVLVAFAPGYQTTETVIDLAGGVHEVEFVMAAAGFTETVEVAAPAPEDAAPSVQVFGPLDVVRLPGAQADVMRYVQNMAGVNALNEEAGLYVRGGDAQEVLTLLDDAVLYHPYRYETVTGGIRGTVDPFLTDGITFSSGGFPARFGNALSGILEMQGLDRPAAPAGQVGLLLTGVSGGAALPVRSRGGVRVSGNWSETRPLFRLNRSPRDFKRYPDSWDVNVSGHYESPRFGSLKVFGMSLRERVGIEIEREAYHGVLEAENANELAYVRWDRIAASGWRTVATLGVSAYRSDTDVGVIDLVQGDRRQSWRADLSHTSARGTVRFGTDGSWARTTYAGQASSAGADYGGVRGVTAFDAAFDDWHAGAYAEMEGAPGIFVPNLGVRVDHFRQTGALTIDPRASLLVRVGGRHRLRAAGGIYHQAPRPYYAGRAGDVVFLQPMRAQHLVGGYEYGIDGDPLRVRIEGYRKRYRRLPLEDPAGTLTSAGYGSAWGLDLAVRRHWPRVSLEAVYGWLNARRRWTSRESVGRFELPDGTWTPAFAIPHGLRATVEAQVTAAATVAASWRTASGRPFTPVVAARRGGRGYVPVYGAINSQRVPRYERLDLSVNVVTPVGLILFAAANNVLGRPNVLDYAYSPDYADRRPVASTLPRSVYFGTTVMLQ